MSSAGKCLSLPLLSSTVSFQKGRTPPHHVQMDEPIWTSWPLALSSPRLLHQVGVYQELLCGATERMNMEIRQGGWEGPGEGSGGQTQQSTRSR
jgi:hypothetical protein